MRYRTKIIAIAAIAFAAVVAGCDNKALLTELATNRLVVVLKGTYESNNPQPWNVPMIGSVRNPDDSAVQDTSVYRCKVTGVDTYPNVFMIDIAEMRLVDGKNWDKHYKFAHERQTFVFGLNDEDPFFNGLGVLMANDDVPSKYYPGILLYVRKMLMDGGRRFQPSAAGWTSYPVWDVYDEHQVPSFNFNKFQIHSHWDSLRIEGIYINRVYPLPVFIGTNLTGLIFQNNLPLTVLEIRMVVKNFIKKFEFYNYADTIQVTHYYALSDWLYDVQNDETQIGGNVLAVGRMYVPGLTGRISGSNGRSHDAHIIAIPAGSPISQYTRPAANPRDHNCNLPNMPGIFYIGSNIEEALERALLFEDYKIKWNDKVPTKCTSYEDYCAKWDAFIGAVGDVKVPELATYALAGGQYSLENVNPGQYDVYIATRAPKYGELYMDGEFAYCGTATVNVGGSALVNCP